MPTPVMATVKGMGSQGHQAVLLSGDSALYCWCATHLVTADTFPRQLEGAIMLFIVADDAR
jgi:hypothetical protein